MFLNDDSVSFADYRSAIKLNNEDLVFEKAWLALCFKVSIIPI